MFGLVAPRGSQFEPAAIETIRERLSELSVARWLSATGPHSANPRSTDAWLEFSISTVSSEDGTAGTANASVRSLLEHHKLRLQLGDPDLLVGWFDADPTPFQVDASLAKLVTSLLQKH